MKPWPLTTRLETPEQMINIYHEFTDNIVASESDVLGLSTAGKKTANPERAKMKENLRKRMEAKIEKAKPVITNETRAPRIR